MADKLGIKLPDGWEPIFDDIGSYGAFDQFGNPIVSDTPISTKGLTPTDALSSPSQNHTRFFKGSGDALSGYRPVSFDGFSTQIMPLNLTPSENAVWTLGHEAGWLTGGAINDAHANGFGHSAVQQFRGLR